MNAPPPLEWHPFYRDKRWLMDWLNGERGYPLDSIVIPVFSDPAAEPGDLTITNFIMHRSRARGLAPYVGRPFVYEWWVGTDDLGRCIASDAHIRYVDEWLRRAW